MNLVLLMLVSLLKIKKTYITYIRDQDKKEEIQTHGKNRYNVSFI